MQVRYSSVADKSFSITGLRKQSSNPRVPRGNPKSSNSFQIWRSLFLFKIPVGKLNTVNDGHTQVKEKTVALASSP